MLVALLNTEHDGYDPSSIREFHMLTRHLLYTRAKCKGGTLGGMNGGLFCGTFPYIIRHELSNVV